MIRIFLDKAWVVWFDLRYKDVKTVLWFHNHNKILRRENSELKDEIRRHKKEIELLKKEKENGGTIQNTERTREH